jgi:hypothetical protein
MKSTSFIKAGITGILLTVVTTWMSCRSHKETAAAVDGKAVYDQPFSEKEYQTDDKYLRYVGFEESSDLMVAKTTAMIQAQTGLAMAANKEVEGMFTNYLNFAKTSATPENVKHIQALFDGIIQIHLPRVRVIGEKAYKDKKTGLFTYYAAVEVDISELEKESVRLADQNQQVKAVIAEKEYRSFMEEKLRKRNSAQN